MTFRSVIEGIFSLREEPKPYNYQYLTPAEYKRRKKRRHISKASRQRNRRK